MTVTKSKNQLGPCGLYCGGCFAFFNGEIKKHSRALQQVLGKFDIYAERFIELTQEPVFKKYPDFKIFLDYLSKVECKGCRVDTCNLFKNCQVRDCHKNMKVDFCFECAEFPCDHTGFDSHLYKRYVSINRRIREIGIKNYYQEIKDKSRY